MWKGERTVTRTEHRTSRIRREKRGGTIGEGNEAGRERALTVGYENRREGEIGTGKNKVG